LRHDRNVTSQTGEFKVEIGICTALLACQRQAGQTTQTGFPFLRCHKKPEPFAPAPWWKPTRPAKGNQRSSNRQKPKKIAFKFFSSSLCVESASEKTCRSNQLRTHAGQAEINKSQLLASSAFPLVWEIAVFLICDRAAKYLPAARRAANRLKQNSGSRHLTKAHLQDRQDRTAIPPKQGIAELPVWCEVAVDKRNGDEIPEI
jgi:hypothetical protein